MPRFKTLDDLKRGRDLAGWRVLLRADLNVPVKDGKVTDATRIERLAPTIKELLAARAHVLVLSHFDRPKGKPVPSMSLAPLAEPLSRAVGAPVRFAPDCVGVAAEAAAGALVDGEVLLMENVRFHAGEEEDDPAFAKALAAIGKFYVNDAFSAAHRAHASTHAIAQLLPSFAGRLMQAELEALAKALDTPQRPLAAVVGGAKVSTKLDLLGNLIKKVDVLVIGGGMANTFLNAAGIEVGRSLCERDLADTARRIAAEAKQAGRRIVLPVDAAAAPGLDQGAAARTVDLPGMDPALMILDVGPKSVAATIAELQKCRTLVWNGPLGAFEHPPFDKGTVAVARAVAELTKAGKLLSVAGGGDTVAALAHAGVEDKFSYVSTAGGAFLEWLEGKELPGVAALMQ
jgi:phosphoglycerate kinase